MTVKASERDPERVCDVGECNAWKKGESRYCRHHAGLEQGGAKEDNTNSVSHGSYVEYEKRYTEVFSDRERDLCDWIEADYLGRYQSVHGYEPPAGFKVRIFNVAVNAVTEMRVNNWYTDKPDELDTGIEAVNAEKHVSESGQVYYRYKKSPHIAAVKHLEQYNRRWLDKLGLLPSPEKEQAESMGDLAYQILESESK